MIILSSKLQPVTANQQLATDAWDYQMSALLIDFYYRQNLR